MPGMTRLRLAAISAFLLFVLGVGARAPVASGDAVGPGCDPTRTAVAYHAGGPALTSHQGDLPIPCAVVAGTGTAAETIEMATIGVNQSDGALFYAPQSTGAAVAPAVTRSRDDGATWQVLTPTLQPGTGSAIPWMDVDPETNRIWFAMIGPYGTCAPQSNPAADTLAQITWSDDEGQTGRSTCRSSVYLHLEVS